jgi:endonuclease/exonuclease/phosphatase family metal-dependent hydrolase
LAKPLGVTTSPASPATTARTTLTAPRLPVDFYFQAQGAIRCSSLWPDVATTPSSDHFCSALAR